VALATAAEVARPAGLDTDVLSVAAQRLPDKIKEAKDEQILLASGSDPRITFEAAAKIYIERVNSSPDFKPRTKAHHQERLDAFIKSWPDVNDCVYPNQNNLKDS
jgi:hypothetical protein